LLLILARPGASGPAGRRPIRPTGRRGTEGQSMDGRLIICCISFTSDNNLQVSRLLSASLSLSELKTF
jgi:hypothetical protein